MLKLWFFLLFLTGSLCAQQKLTEINVTKVVDGDTFYGTDSLGTDIKFRLIGMDCPESRHPRKPKQPFSKEATALMKELISGKKVMVEYDVQKRGPYQRDLVYVFLEDGMHVNAELVKRGMARAATYPPNVKYEDLFYRLQVEAREDSIGMWSIEYEW